MSILKTCHILSLFVYIGKSRRWSFEAPSPLFSFNSFSSISCSLRRRYSFVHFQTIIPSQVFTKLSPATDSREIRTILFLFLLISYGLCLLRNTCNLAVVLRQTFHHRTKFRCKTNCIITSINCNAQILKLVYDFLRTLNLVNNFFLIVRTTLKGCLTKSTCTGLLSIIVDFGYFIETGLYY